MSTTSIIYTTYLLFSNYPHIVNAVVSNSLWIPIMQKTSVLIPDVLYIMIHNKKYELAKVRAKANVRIQDLALALNLNPIDLVQMESGKQTPSLSVIAIYHLLFNAPFGSVFTNLYADMHTYLNERSTKLIEELESSSSPKSQQRVQAFKRIVKLLNTDIYD